MLLDPAPDGADAVTLHVPAPVICTVLFVVELLQGPEVLKVIGKLDVVVAFSVTGLLPYWTFANCGKLIVCETIFESAETIMNVPETGAAAL